MKLSIVCLSLFMMSALAAKEKVQTSSDDSNLSAQVTVSPYEPVAMEADPTAPITFAEFAIGTVISTQYADDKGIVFGGNSPVIASDASNPEWPVLSAAKFTGTITGAFVDESGNPATVRSFSMDVGYLNEAGSITLKWFGRSGDLLGSVTNSVADGFEVMRGNGGNIASWSIDNSAKKDSFAIDNIVSNPENCVTNIEPRVGRCNKVQKVAALVNRLGGSPPP